MAKTGAFDNFTDRYDRWFDDNRWAYQSELRAVKKCIPQTGEGFEIGVGSGRFAVPLGITCGVEPSGKMRVLAQRRGVEVVDAQAEKLPFDDLSFSFALMVTTICFLDDVEAAFKEAYRVLRPEGKLIIGFVDKESTLGRTYQGRKEHSLFYKEATFYSVEEVLVWLKKVGFKDFEFYQTLFGDLKEIREVEPVKQGYGEGAFVVVSALKG